MLRDQLCPFRSQGFKDLVASAAAISELQSPQLEESIHRRGVRQSGKPLKWA